MLKELEAITPSSKNFWKTIVSNLAENPGSIQPVILQDPDTKAIVGEFYASIAKEGERVYLQVENASEEMGNFFDTDPRGEGWLMRLGGIYRIPITSIDLLS